LVTSGSMMVYPGNTKGVNNAVLLTSCSVWGGLFWK
jgi:hypothetical protein